MEVAVAGVTPSFLTQLTLERGDYPLGAEFPRCVGPEWRKYVEVSTFIQGDSSCWSPRLGWLWLGCSTFLLSRSAISAKLSLARAKLGSQWNTRNPSQPNPGLRADESRCNGFIVVVLTRTICSFIPSLLCGCLRGLRWLLRGALRLLLILNEVDVTISVLDCLVVLKRGLVGGPT